MSKTPAAKTTAKETVAAPPARAAKPKTPRTAPVAAVAPKPRVRTVKHSKAAAPVASPVALPALSAHDQIAFIAYGYWEARGFQPGSPEQDWLRAEREFLARA